MVVKKHPLYGRRDGLSPSQPADAVAGVAVGTAVLPGVGSAIGTHPGSVTGCKRGLNAGRQVALPLTAPGPESSTSPCFC